LSECSTGPWCKTALDIYRSRLSFFADSDLTSLCCACHHTSWLYWDTSIKVTYCWTFQ